MAQNQTQDGQDEGWERLDGAPDSQDEAQDGHDGASWGVLKGVLELLGGMPIYRYACTYVYIYVYIHAQIKRASDVKVDPIVK